MILFLGKFVILEVVDTASAATWSSEAPSRSSPSSWRCWQPVPRSRPSPEGLRSSAP